jgi:hypothetical protein
VKSPVRVGAIIVDVSGRPAVRVSDEQGLKVPWLVDKVLSTAVSVRLDKIRTCVDGGAGFGRSERVVVGFGTSDMEADRVRNCKTMIVDLCGVRVSFLSEEDVGFFCEVENIEGTLLTLGDVASRKKDSPILIVRGDG